MDAWKWGQVLLAERKAIRAKEAKALAAIHAADRSNAEMSAWQNAADTMVERGCPNARESSFAFRRAYISTLEMLADAPADFDLRAA